MLQAEALLALFLLSEVGASNFFVVAVAKRVPNPRLAQGTWGSEGSLALGGLSWIVLGCGGLLPLLGGVFLGRKKALA